MWMCTYCCIDIRALLPTAVLIDAAQGGWGGFGGEKDHPGSPRNVHDENTSPPSKMLWEVCSLGSSNTYVAPLPPVY